MNPAWDTLAPAELKKYVSSHHPCSISYYVAACLCAEKQCVISKTECEESEITQEEADTFMSGEVKKEEATPQKEEETADDLLADL